LIVAICAALVDSLEVFPRPFTLFRL